MKVLRQKLRKYIEVIPGRIPPHAEITIAHFSFIQAVCHILNPLNSAMIRCLGKNTEFSAYTREIPGIYCLILHFQHLSDFSKIFSLSGIIDRIAARIDSRMKESFRLIQPAFIPGNRRVVCEVRKSTALMRKSTGMIHMEIIDDVFIRIRNIRNLLQPVEGFPVDGGDIPGHISGIRQQAHQHDADRIAQLEDSTSMKVIGAAGDWYKIQWANATGCMMKKFVRT